MKKILLGLILSLSFLYSANLENIDFNKLSILDTSKDGYMDYIHSKDIDKEKLKLYFKKPMQTTDSMLINAIAYDYYYKDYNTSTPLYEKLIEKKNLNLESRIIIIDALLRYDINNIKRLQYKLKISQCLASFKFRTKCLYYKNLMTGLIKNKYPRKLNSYRYDYPEQIDYIDTLFNEN